MSAIAKPSHVISPEEYLEGEKFTELRHEYVEGHVYAMAGASDDHNRISGNIFNELSNRLRGHPCEAFTNDMKVKIPPKFSEAFYYPDVLVAGDPADNNKYFRERPTVILEVISPETERIDRREKQIAYWHIPTLKSYIIIEQERMAATVFRRAGDGWDPENLEGKDAVLKLPELGVEVPLARFYERTALAKS